MSAEVSVGNGKVGRKERAKVKKARRQERKEGGLNEQHQTSTDKKNVGRGMGDGGARRRGTGIYIPGGGATIMDDEPGRTLRVCVFGLARLTFI